VSVVDDAHGPESTVLGRFIDSARSLPPDRLHVAIANATALIQASNSDILLIDYSQSVLVPYERSVEEGHRLPDSEVLLVSATMAGRAYITEQSVEIDGLDVHGTPFVTRLAPILNAWERMGVLSVTFASIDAARRSEVDALGRALGELLVVRGLYTDSYTKCRRRREMTVAGELQWQVLPPLAANVPTISVAGLLEPAYDVGGDGFDFAFTGDDLDLVIYDAVGHDLHSSLLSAAVMASLRQARRADAPLDEWCCRADHTIREAFDDCSYATAQVARLRGDTGLLRWVNAGHPLPLLVRGSRVVGELPGTVRSPIGLRNRRSTDRDPVTDTWLQPGDRVLFYSDGIIEGGTDRGHPFGSGRLVDLLERAQLDQSACAETLRRLGQAVLDHSEYRLRDDATMLLIEWRGRP
jgi:hypothetical protein